MKLKRLLIFAVMSAALSCGKENPSGDGHDWPVLPDEEPDVEVPDPGIVGSLPAVSVRNGEFVTSEGALPMWGVNLQPCLSWEYDNRLAPRGIPETSDALCSVAYNNVMEVSRLGADIIRVHLTPADFTDAEGNIVESPYLDALDYMVAVAASEGIYTTITLINEMSKAYVSASVFATAERDDWAMDPDVIEKSERYVGSLLGRVNPYTGRSYAEETAIAYWELLNEPDFWTYDEIGQHTGAAMEYSAWLKETGNDDSSASYWDYRRCAARDYIDGMQAVMEECGAVQPVIWNHKWAGYRRSAGDIFQGVLQAAPDGVSICAYPGQNLVPSDYWNSPEDLTGEDFSSWFSDRVPEEMYGWLSLPAYSDMVKVAYEFETFFNQSAYLYPVMALWFRSLGLSSAAMWTYTEKEYAQYHAGSHFLSLTCTPPKAAGFIVAGEIFRSVPAGTLFDYTNANEQTGRNYAISRSRDLAVFCDGRRLCHTGDITSWCPVDIEAESLESIAGRKNSSIVSYSGNGLYFIDIEDDSLYLTIEPDIVSQQNAWDSGLANRTMVTELGSGTDNEMGIMLPGWTEGGFTLYSLSGGEKTVLSELESLERFGIRPGDYVIERK